MKRGQQLRLTTPFIQLYYTPGQLKINKLKYLVIIN